MGTLLISVYCVWLLSLNYMHYTDDRVETCVKRNLYVTKTYI